MNNSSLLTSRLLLFNEAIKYYGLKEMIGKKDDNPIILNMFDSIGHSWVENDETAWCSCFVNFVAQEVGLEISGKLNARSWLNIGEEVLMPKIGDIVIFWRENPNSWKGHVGLYVNEDEDFIYVLGGNQDNMVCIKPYSKKRLLGYRKLQKK